MPTDTTANTTAFLHHGPYLDVVRLGDGRYSVQFVKQGALPRTSYTNQAHAVVKQAQRAGNIPIHTSDAELRRLCLDHLVEII
jgi:hypothetical protein